MPICNSEPHLITGSMNSNNITFAVAWNYSHNAEELHLSRVVLNYSIPMRGNLSQISTRITVSENLRINQTSKMITVSSMNVNSGAFVINITASNSQGSTTTMCPSLHLGKCKQVLFLTSYLASYRHLLYLYWFFRCEYHSACVEGCTQLPNLGGKYI